MYDWTPDHEPVLGPTPEYGGRFAAFGWSGHGFAHAPVIGEIMAQVVLEGHAPGWDLAPFRRSRFSDNDLIPGASGTAPPHPMRPRRAVVSLRPPAPGGVSPGRHAAMSRETR